MTAVYPNASEGRYRIRLIGLWALKNNESIFPQRDRDPVSSTGFSRDKTLSQ